MKWITRLFARLGRVYWIRRIDRVLAAAYEHGHIDSWLLHALDHRLKYEPRKRFEQRPPR